MKLEGEPWGAWWGSDIFAGNICGPASELAKLLKGFPVVPKVFREDDITIRGYSIDAFKEHFERYLPPLCA